MERHDFKLNLLPIPKFSDPKICEINITCPCYDIECPYPPNPNFTNENRVMSMKNRESFVLSLRSLVGSGFEIDDFYLFVSGCLQVRVKLRGRMTRTEAKDFVKIALWQSGRFLTLQEWMNKRDQTAKSIKFSFGGVTPENVAYQ